MTEIAMIVIYTCIFIGIPLIVGTVSAIAIARGEAQPLVSREEQLAEREMLQAQTPVVNVQVEREENA